MGPIGQQGKPFSSKVRLKYAEHMWKIYGLINRNRSCIWQNHRLVCQTASGRRR